MKQIEIPRENANDDEVLITNIYVDNFQSVMVGDPLIEFETSKAAIEIEAAAAGIISLNISVGDTVPVGKVVAIIDFEKRVFDKVEDHKPKDAEVNSVFSAKALKLIEENNLTFDMFNELAFVKEADVLTFLNSKTDDSSLNLSRKFSENEIALYGAGLQCQVVLDLIESENLGLNVAAIIDSNPNKKSIDGVTIFHRKHLATLKGNGLRKVHLCIGNGSAKARIADELKSLGFDICNVIANSAIVSKKAKLGNGVFIGSNAYVGREVVINDLVQINHGVSIAHHCIIGEGTFIADGCKLGGTVKIGRQSNLGIGVIINRDIQVFEETSIPSGALIVDNILQDENFKFKKVLR